MMSAAEKLDVPTGAPFTYEDYLKWDTPGERWELIDGEVFALASPRVNHQRATLRLSIALFNHFNKRGCEVFSAPMDVVLKPSVLPFMPKDQQDKQKPKDTVVQPDVLVVCDPKKIGENAILGAPDMVVEVLSPTNAHHDTVVKFAKYREHAVGEIWFVDPDTRSVSVYTYDATAKEYRVAFFDETCEKIPVGIGEDFFIYIDEIFDVGDEVEDGLENE